MQLDAADASRGADCVLEPINHPAPSERIIFNFSRSLAVLACQPASLLAVETPIEAAWILIGKFRP